MEIQYICQNCGSLNIKNAPKKTYTCKNCYKKTIATEQPFEQNNTFEQNETNNNEAVDLDFNVIGDDVSFQKTETTNPIQNVQQRKTNPIQSKGIPAETIKKYLEQIDTQIKKKAGADIWDISAKEEMNVSEAWASYFEEVMPTVETKTGKLANALILTAVTYAPRSFAFYQEYQKRNPKQKKQKQQETTEQQETENSELLGQPQPVQNVQSLKPKDAGRPYYPENENNFN